MTKTNPSKTVTFAAKDKVVIIPEDPPTASDENTSSFPKTQSSFIQNRDVTGVVKSLVRRFHNFFTSPSRNPAVTPDTDPDSIITTPGFLQNNSFSSTPTTNFDREGFSVTSSNSGNESDGTM